MPAALVLREWKVLGPGPKAQEPPRIRIEGRAPGLLGLVLDLLGFDPTTRLEVSSQALYLTRSSARGQLTRIIPVDRVAAIEYGYAKPTWMLFLTVALLWTLVLWIIPLVLYFLGRASVISVTEEGGRVATVCFRAGVVDGVRVDHNECARVSALIRDLMLERAAPAPAPEPAPVQDRDTSAVESS